MNKQRFDLEYKIICNNNGEQKETADAKTVMVAFDYTIGKSIEIPAAWIEAINNFESNNF